MRRQKTLRRPAAVRGFGLISGRDVVLRFLPAPEDTGILFVRTDLPGHPRIRAHISRRVPSDRRTTLAEGGVRVEMTEHILAALRGLDVDNCIIEISADEPPGGDGSSLAFADAVLEAGLCAQEGWVTPFVLGHPVCVAEEKAFLAAFPARRDHGEVHYVLDYTGQSRSIGRQVFQSNITPVDFLAEMAAARTFLTASEAAYLRHLGWGSRTTTRDLLIFDDHGPVDNVLRYQNEPARHKALDIVGDIALVGRPVVACFAGYRSGHRLNAAMAEVLANADLCQTEPPAAPWVWPNVLARVSDGRRKAYAIASPRPLAEPVLRGAVVLAALIEWAGSPVGGPHACKFVASIALGDAPSPVEPFEIVAEHGGVEVRAVQSGRVLLELQMDAPAELAKAA